MGQNKNISTGIMYGIIIGLIYAILVFVRWSVAQNLIAFGTVAFLGYLIVLGLLFLEAYQRRKLEPGGIIDLKNLFQTLFISVLVFELIFAAYTYIHLAFVDTEVIDKMKAGMEQMLDKAPEGQITPEKREEALKRFDDMKKATEIGQVLKGYLISIAISGFFAFVTSLIMRKKNPNEGMPQSM
jgi:tetrahydromethanopterin S-methyltransferase subunit G